MTPEPALDDEPSASAYASILIHDHTAPGGCRTDHEGLVAKIQVTPNRGNLDEDPDEDEAMGPNMEVRIYIQESDRVIQLLLTAEAAAELCNRLADAYDEACGDGGPDA